MLGVKGATDRKVDIAGTGSPFSFRGSFPRKVHAPEVNPKWPGGNNATINRMHLACGCDLSATPGGQNRWIIAEPLAPRMHISPSRDGRA
jgi:hypothetical protein